MGYFYLFFVTIVVIQLVTSGVTTSMEEIRINGMDTIGGWYSYTLKVLQSQSMVYSNNTSIGNSGDGDQSALATDSIGPGYLLPVPTTDRRTYGCFIPTWWLVAKIIPNSNQFDNSTSLEYERTHFLLFSKKKRNVDRLGTSITALVVVGE
jgi:hypothetical protein